ncbi:MAG: hypothetical protein ISN28_14350 [Ectothiorhodospiraceae bacterium AqS1]|nr:hypothetical protein [Ectothiorhodospiraceae bacterium AqS1]
MDLAIEDCSRKGGGRVPAEPIRNTKTALSLGERISVDAIETAISRKIERYLPIRIPCTRKRCAPASISTLIEDGARLAQSGHCPEA